jgi:hypothetical protein
MFGEITTIHHITLTTDSGYILMGEDLHAALGIQVSIFLIKASGGVIYIKSPSALLEIISNRSKSDEYLQEAASMLLHVCTSAYP